MFAHAMADGKDAAFATTYADHYEEQTQLEKPHFWASGYAQAKTEGKTEELARSIADHYEPIRNENTQRGSKWAYCYAEARALGLSDEVARSQAEQEYGNEPIRRPDWMSL